MPEKTKGAKSGRPVREVGIPMAIRVKDAILDVVEENENLVGTITFRRLCGKDVSKEISLLQGSLAVLYLKLKAKFPKKHPVHKFNDAIIENRELSFAELSGLLDIFIYKIEELKITKFEYPVVSKDEVMA